MRMSLTDESNGVSIRNDAGTSCESPPYCGTIVMANAGTYNLQFSAQLLKVSANTYITADIWVRRQRSGESSFTDIPFTSTRVYVPNDTDYSVAAWNFMLPSLAGDQYQLVWASADANWAALRIVSGTADGYPAGQEPPQIPGLILTVQSAG